MSDAKKLEISNRRDYLESLSSVRNLTGMMCSDMLDALTVINEIPSQVVSHKPLEVFVYANCDTEQLPAVRDIIVLSWLDGLANTSPYNFSCTFAAPRNILRETIGSVYKEACTRLTAPEQDAITRLGVNPICHYDRTTLYIRGDSIWRRGVLQKVDIDDYIEKKPTWRRRLCLATFATDIKYIEFINPAIPGIWM